MKVLNQFPPLPPTGPARVAIVGEAPGKSEVEQGKPFVGQSGHFLNSLLSQAGIVRDQCFVGNVCQARPQGNDFNTLDWEGADVQEGIAQLREDLRKFDPTIILCLGNAALFVMKRPGETPRKTNQRRKEDILPPEESALEREESPAENAPADGAQGEPATGEAKTPHETKPGRGAFQWPDRVGNWRGSLFLSTFLGEDRAVKCLATYHPAAVLRDFSQQAYSRFDVKRLAAESKTRELVLPKRDIHTCASIPEVEHWLLRFRDAGLLTSIDIEGGVNGISCISFSQDPGFAFVMPFAHYDGPSYWENEEDEVAAWAAVQTFLEDPSIPKLGQHFSYDSFALAWTMGICVRNVAFDTEVGMFECFAELKKGLATQCSILTKQPFYKPDKEDGELKFSSDEEFYFYNGLDSCATLECHFAQMALLNDAQRAHYQFNVELFPALMFMMLHGLKWDGEAAAAAREETLQEAWKLQARIDEEASNNPKQDNNDLLQLRLMRAELHHRSEAGFVGLVMRQLGCKTPKRKTLVNQERWQPMRWNGRKWVKGGKILTELPAGACTQTTGDLIGILTNGPMIKEGAIWLKECHREVEKNMPFTPLTLPDCEDFILDSKQGEWKRVKAIWKELNAYAKTADSKIAGTDHHTEVSSTDGVESTMAEKEAPSRETPDRTQQNKLGCVLRPAQGEVADPDPANSQDAGRIDENGQWHQRRVPVSGGKAALLGELSTLLSLSINVGSTQADGDAQRFLYEICGLPLQYKKEKGRKTDKISSDQNALVKLFADTQDVRVLWVLQLRRLRKMAADLEVAPDEDGRMRFSLSLVKETGRMAASKSPTGNGTNLMALNKDLRHLALADEGCVFRQRDLKGADSWTVALECAALGDSTMLDDLKAGMRPAEILALIVTEGAQINSLSREAITERVKATKRSWPSWLYPGCKAGIHLTSYAGRVPTLIQTLLRNSLGDLPLNLEEAKPIVLTHFQGEAIQRAALTRYPGILKWHRKIEQHLVSGDGVLRTSTGHVRRFYGRKKEFVKGQWRACHDTFKEYLASLPQLLTTLATKRALWRMWHDEENNPGDGNLRETPLLAVHDSLLGMCAKEDSAWCLEKERTWFNNEIEVSGLRAVIPTDLQTGKDWSVKDTL